eukprot:1594972-Prymnesium_polylepis.1
MRAAPAPSPSTFWLRQMSIFRTGDANVAIGDKAPPKYKTQHPQKVMDQRVRSILPPGRGPQSARAATISLRACVARIRPMSVHPPRRSRRVASRSQWRTWG